MIKFPWKIYTYMKKEIKEKKPHKNFQCFFKVVEFK